MRDLFELVDTKSTNRKIRNISTNLGGLDYDTTILASKDKKVVDDYQKVCYDTFYDVVSNIKDVLSSIKKDADTNVSSIAYIKQLRHELSDIAKKWDKIKDNPEGYCNQMLQDATSERIYTKDTALHVLYLLKQIYTFLTDKDSRTKTDLVDRIYKKCLNYAADSNFDTLAGSPMKVLGYTDISVMYDVSNKYKTILELYSKEDIQNELSNFNTKLSMLENQIDTVNMLVKRNIDRAEKLDDSATSQYNTLLDQSKALAAIHRICMLATKLLGAMHKTVDNLTHVVYNSQLDSPLPNMTQPMGGALLPDIIETQTIANESLSRLSNRYQTYLNRCSLSALEDYRSLNKYKTLIDRMTVGAIEDYVAFNTWDSRTRSEMDIDTKIVSVLKEYRPLVAKLASSRSYLHILPYPVSMGIAIPELKRVWSLIKTIDPSVLYATAIESKWYLEEDMSDIANDQIAHIQDFGIYEKPKRKVPISGTEIGIGSTINLDGLIEQTLYTSKSSLAYLDSHLDISDNKDIQKELDTTDDKTLCILNYIRAHTLMDCIQWLDSRLLQNLHSVATILRDIYIHA